MQQLIRSLLISIRKIAARASLIKLSTKIILVIALSHFTSMADVGDGKQPPTKRRQDKGDCFLCMSQAIAATSPAIVPGHRTSH